MSQSKVQKVDLKGLFKKSFIIQLLLTLSLLLVLCRCGQAPQETYTSGTFAHVYNVTLKTACIQCHVPGGSATTAGVTLDFSTQTTAYQSLTTSVVSGGSTKNTCPNISIVLSKDANKSYLAGVLFDSYHTSNFAGVTGCTPYSAHLTDQSLSSDEQTSIVNWINNGALNN
jgi:hypothetical protein